MVVFTCNNCGESLQKPRVEKHYFSCRGEKFVTCVDCFKDFRGNEYTIHTKCISEEERYSGKDFVAKSKKGEVKQNSWMEMIKSIILHESKLSQNYKNLLETISHYNNVPRKKAKFINFIKSSTGGRTNIKDIEGIWDIIEKYKNQNTSHISDNRSNSVVVKKNDVCNKIEDNCKDVSSIAKKNDIINDVNSNGNDKLDHCEDVPKPKKKKRKADTEQEALTNEANPIEVISKKKRHSLMTDSNEVENEQVQSNTNESLNFSFNEQILNILSQREQIAKHKLYKKLLKKYTNFKGEPITEEQLEKKVNKKLKKMCNVVVIDNYVKLVNL